MKTDMELQQQSCEGPSQAPPHLETGPLMTIYSSDSRE